MNQENLREKLLHASEHLDKNKLTKVMDSLIEITGVDTQNGLAAEECAELIVALSKYKRFGGKFGTRLNLIEEMADVLLSIMKLQRMYGISLEYLHKVINVKIDRAEEKIKRGEVH